MNNLPNLYIGTEESPLGNVNAIYSLREVGLDINFSNMKDGFPQLKVTQVGMNQYQIDGIQSKDFGNVYAFIMTQGKSEGRGKGSFVDFLFFLTDNMPTNTDIPIMALEHTKNSTTESGNMPDQRSSKSIALSKFYGQSVPYIYMTESDKHKTPSAVHNLAFARIKFLGGKVLFADEGKLGYREASKATISSLQDLLSLEAKKEAPRNGLANKITVSNGSIHIQSNLHKSSGHHDPNEGYVASTVTILSTLSPNSKFILENHGRDKEFFIGKDNKFMKALSGLNVWAKLKSGKEIKISGSSSNRTQYWKPCVTGEKLSTFSLEVQLRLQGWETIFANHAGCGLSNIVSPSGSVSTMKKSGQHGQRGIPDLVMFHPAKNKCLVIEGETSENYSGKKGKGVNQVKLPEFKTCFEEQILPLLPKGTVCESYICTYGARVQQRHNFFSLTPNGGLFFEQNAKPIWRVKR